MIVTEFMENGALDAFLKVRPAKGQFRRGHTIEPHVLQETSSSDVCIPPTTGTGGPASSWSASGYAAGHSIRHELPQWPQLCP